MLAYLFVKVSRINIVNFLLIIVLYICIVISMKTTNTSNKRIFAWISPEIHRKAKAAAALEGKDLQDLVAEVLTERIDRMGTLTPGRTESTG